MSFDQQALEILQTMSDDIREIRKILTEKPNLLSKQQKGEE